MEQTLLSRGLFFRFTSEAYFCMYIRSHPCNAEKCDSLQLKSQKKMSAKLIAPIRLFFVWKLF